MWFNEYSTSQTKLGDSNDKRPNTCLRSARENMVEDQKIGTDGTGVLDGARSWRTRPAMGGIALETVRRGLLAANWKQVGLARPD